MTDDPFATADLRRRVLAAWAASPARFREDANAEDDLVRGGYRDRVVVELAQNAADAATRAGVPGRLLLSLAGGVLTASNTGAPLDAAGVESMSTLRASAKRAASAVGRFGVGFAAVLAVTDRPEVASTSGAVRWDADQAAEAVDGIPALADEAGRRHGQLPVLRLPWPSGAAPEDAFATSVRLPLRDAAAEQLVRHLLTEVDDALLLALPALDAVTVEVDGVRREVVSDASRWQVVRRSGDLAPDLLADRPVEERDRPWWSLTWALPAAGQALPGVLYAPTPTDEPLELPALLVASFPLDPTRRHVAPGPLTDALVGRAATAYVDLVADTDDPLALLPTPVPAGRLDGALRAAVTDAIRSAPLLASTDGRRVAPRDAVAVVGAGPGLRGRLAEALGPLVPDVPALDRLGGRRVGLAEAVESLAALDRGPAWWRVVYDELGDVRDPEVLAVLPVPLADGRLVRGPRSVLLPTDELAGLGLDGLGLRVADPDAVHDVLRRAGAVDAGAAALLDAPEVRAAVAGAWDEPDPLALGEVVLALLATAGSRPGDLPWLGALPLPDADGAAARADDLVVPGSPLAALADRDVVGLVSSALVDRWGRSVLAAAGVLETFTVREVEDVVLDEAAVDDELADWVHDVLADLDDVAVPPTARIVEIVPELDVVADDRWADALRLLSADPRLRAAVVSPVRLDLGDGRTREVPSYAGWLLRDRARVDGRPAAGWALAGAGLDGLYDVLDHSAVSGVDPDVLGAVGVVTDLTAAVVADPDDVLARLADERRTVPAGTLSAVWRVLASSAERVTPPDRLRVAPDRLADADDAVVVDAPEHLQVLADRPVLTVPLPVAVRLADLLDLDLSSEVVGTPDLSGGVRRDVPEQLHGLVDGLPTEWWEHDELAVDGVPVSWWRAHDTAVHAATVDGLARGLAAATGRWELRLVLAAALADPERAAELAAEEGLSG